jgi:mevalonate kinase
LEKTCPQCRKEVSETTQLFFSEDDEKDEDELEKQQLREFVNQAQMLLDNNDAQKRELEKNISQMEKMLSNKSASGFNQDVNVFKILLIVFQNVLFN